MLINQLSLMVPCGYSFWEITE